MAASKGPGRSSPFARWASAIPNGFVRSVKRDPRFLNTALKITGTPRSEITDSSRSRSAQHACSRRCQRCGRPPEWLRSCEGLPRAGKRSRRQGGANQDTEHQRRIPVLGVHAGHTGPGGADHPNYRIMSAGRDTYARLLRSFLRYARRNPDILRANAAVAVLRALQDA